MRVTLQINNREHRLDIDADMPLLWVLRDRLHLTGTKFGCGIGICGACTVHVEGLAVRSCVTPVSSVQGAKIRTIEGLSVNDNHPVQRAWVEEDVPQCGFCQPGMVMAAAALLESKPMPTEADIDAAMTNICRCGTYSRVRRAIRRATRS